MAAAISIYYDSKCIIFSLVFAKKVKIQKIKMLFH